MGVWHLWGCALLKIRRVRSCVTSILIGSVLLLLAPAMAVAAGTAFLLDIKGPIGPAVSDYIHRGLEKAREENATVVILRMDTPGGLDTSMRTIIKDIIASPIPVISFVAPGGARAASAGTYILYASHIAAMAPGTNLGAATPVSIGVPKMPGQPPEKKPDAPADKSAPPDEKSSDEKDESATDEPPPKPATTMERKVINDATAYIRSLAEMRGRDADWGEDAVRKASSLSAEAALKRNVIDVIASDVVRLLEAVDGRVVMVLEQPHTLKTADLTVRPLVPDWRSQFLNVITNPNVAIILMMIGMYGLIFEFANPGFVLPGVVGAICLILAFYAFETLPINYAGLGLIILGVAFLIAEAFMPSFGALGLGGVVALVLGLVMLVDTEAPGFGITWQFISLVTAASVAFFLAVFTLALKAHSRPVETGQPQIIGYPGLVISWGGSAGRVRVQGEVWSAVSESTLAAGEAIEVVSLNGLTLGVKPSEHNLSEKRGN